MTEPTTLTKAIVAATPSKEEGERAAATIDKAVAADPVLRNKLGQERPVQSGITLIGSGGILVALGNMLVQVGMHGADIGSYDLKEFVDSGIVIALFVGILYRRWMPGLKPVFWRWMN